MKKYTYGAILKNRIKEQGYTQEEFAEKIGISLSALKKYISDKVIYNIEILERISRELNCSPEYLLGKSRSPINENMILSEDLRLSDKAIEIIKKYKTLDEDSVEYKTFFYIVNSILGNEDLIIGIYNFLIATKYYEEGTEYIKNIIINELNEAYDENINMMIKTREAYLITIVDLIERIKDDMPEEIHESLIRGLKEIKKIKTEMNKG